MRVQLGKNSTPHSDEGVVVILSKLHTLFEQRGTDLGVAGDGKLEDGRFSHIIFRRGRFPEHDQTRRALEVMYQGNRTGYGSAR